MARSKNPRLKKAFEPVEYTPEQILEVQKCANDPIYFIKNYVYIKHPIRGQIKFALYTYQEEMIHNFLRYNFNINLLSRQVGKTESISAYILWFSIFNEDKTIVIAANKSSNAMEIIAKIQNAYEELPNWLKPGIDENSWNKHECKFDNRSRIISEATSKDTGRGKAVSLLYVDEMAFVKDHMQKEMWDSVWPTLSTGGSLIISSTPNGDINLFAELWRGAELGINPLHPFTVPWNAPPGRDEKFKEEQIGALGLLKWQQEYECVHGDTIVTIKNSITGEIFLVSIAELYDML